MQLKIVPQLKIIPLGMASNATSADQNIEKETK
jgi:hypothetical protein